MDKDIEKFAEQSIEEDISAMDEANEEAIDVFNEASNDANDSLKALTDTLKEDVFDPEKAIEQLNLDEYTLIELNLAKKDIVKLYHEAVDMRDTIRDLFNTVANMNADDEISKGIADANLEGAASNAASVTSDAYNEFMAYTLNQIEGYDKIISTIDQRINAKKLEIDTPAKSREDVRLASNRLKERLPEGQASRRRERVLDKMVEAYSPDYDNKFLKERSNKSWTYLPYAKEAVKILRKEPSSILLEEASKLINANVSLSDEVVKKGILPSHLIIPALTTASIALIETSNLKNDPADKYKATASSVLTYVIIKDWSKIISSGQKKGNGAYVRVMLSNIVEIALDNYDCEISKSVIAKDLEEISTGYFNGIRDVLPKSWFE